MTVIIDKRAELILKYFPITNYVEGVKVLSSSEFSIFKNSEVLNDFNLYDYIENGYSVFNSIFATNMKLNTLEGLLKLSNDDERFDYLLSLSSNYNNETKMYHSQGVFYKEWSPAHENGIFLDFNGAHDVMNHPDSDKTSILDKFFKENIVDRVYNVILSEETYDKYDSMGEIVDIIIASYLGRNYCFLLE